MTIVILAIAMGAGCNHDSKKNKLFPFGDGSVINDTGGNIGEYEGAVQGISNNENITVVNGKILVTVNNGVLQIAGENVVLSVQGNDGLWQLAPGVTITLKDNNNNIVAGTVVVDPTTGNVSFIPSEPLNVNALYTIEVTSGGNTYTATVIIAVDDINQPNSMFADVPVHNISDTYPVQDCIVNGKAIFGWEFPPRFKIALIDKEIGAKAYLNFYGIYDIPAYSDLVFYQRWVGTWEPVKDYLWSGNWIWVDEIDYSIDTQEHDYSFKRTYAEIRIIDAAGNDITTTSAAKFVVVALPDWVD